MIWVLVGSYPKGMLHDLLVTFPAVSDMAWMGTCTAIALNFGNQSIFCSFHVNVGLVSESGFTCLFTLVDCTGSHLVGCSLHVCQGCSHLCQSDMRLQDSHITPWLRVQTGTP